MFNSKEYEVIKKYANNELLGGTNEIYKLIEEGYFKTEDDFKIFAYKMESNGLFKLLYAGNRIVYIDPNIFEIKIFLSENN